MNSIKCRSCGLSNFSTEIACRRCGTSLIETASKKSGDKSPSSFSIFPWIFLVIAGGVGYYFYTGVEANVGQINANEAKRLEEQKKDPTTGMSRTEFQKHKTGTYSNAMHNNPSFQAQRKQAEETQKVMEQASNSNAQ